jgi:transcriptional regulator with XRE-family HTH domain
MVNRKLTQAQVAAFIGKPAQTISSWFADDRIPRPDTCRALSRVLRVPELEVLRIAGHLSASGEEAAEPPLPAWLTSVLAELEADELRVVDATARGLLALREERAIAEPEHPEDPGPYPRRPRRKGPQT